MIAHPVRNDSQSGRLVLRNSPAREALVAGLPNACNLHMTNLAEPADCRIPTAPFNDLREARPNAPSLR